MIIVVGVEMKGVCRQLKKVLRILEVIFKAHGSLLIIKGTRMGFDKDRAAHETGRAIDIESPTHMHVQVYTRLRLCLGFNYIIRQHATHMHIEWSPMPAEHIRVERWVSQLLEKGVKKC